MVTGILMAAGFCVYIAATWMYGQKEEQASAYLLSPILRFY